MIRHPEYILGLDVGTKRTGVAIAHQLARLPRPLITLNQTDAIYQTIVALVEAENVQTIVVGLPRRLDGSYSDQTRFCEQFAQTLAGQTDAHVVLSDETLTSVDAEAVLGGGRHDKAAIDATAAVLILERYFAGQPQKAQM